MFQSKKAIVSLTALSTEGYLNIQWLRNAPHKWPFL